MERIRFAWHVLKQVLFGMFVYEFALANHRAAKHIEQLILFATLGDILGVPILPPYYSLRIFPHYALDMDRWKLYVSRERDFTDMH